MISHKTKLDVINRLLKPERMTDEKIMGREISILKKIADRHYDSEEFWRSVEFGYKVNSLAWFVGGGAAELEQKWRAFKFSNINELDSPPKLETTEGELPPLQKRDSVVDWIDS